MEGTDNFRCQPTEHDYHPLPREQRGETATGSPGADNRTVVYDIEPARLYCQRCGWVRDLPA